MKRVQAPPPPPFFLAPSPHPNICEREEHDGWKAFKCPALPYVQLLFHLEVSNHPFLTNSRKGHWKGIRETALLPLAHREKRSALLGKLCWGRAEMTPLGCPLVQNLSCKAQACSSACDTVRAISLQEWQRQAEVRRDRKLFSLVFLHSHLEPDLDPKSFVQLNKEVNRSNYFLR